MFIEKNVGGSTEIKLDTALFEPTKRDFFEKRIFKIAMNSECAKVESLHFLIALCGDTYGWKSFSHFINTTGLDPEVLVSLAQRRLKTANQPCLVDGTKKSFTDDAIKIFTDLTELKETFIPDALIGDFFVTIAVLKNIPDDMKKRVLQSRNVDIDSVCNKMVNEWETQREAEKVTIKLFDPETGELERTLFNAKSYALMESAAQIASKLGYAKLEGLHIFLSFLESDTKIVQEVLDSVKVNITREKELILRDITIADDNKTTIKLINEHMLENLKEQLIMAYKRAYKNHKLSNADLVITEKDLFNSTLNHGGNKLNNFLAERFPGKLEKMRLKAETFVCKSVS